MDSKSPKGILVTGAPRSGTSWVGRMLSLASDTNYLHEPLNNQFAVKSFNEKPFPYWFMYLNKANQDAYLKKISRMIGLQPGPRISTKGKQIPIIKDPIAVFSSEWLANTYDLDVVFLVRHPGAVIKSILTLEWNTGPKVFFRQRPLMDAYLSEYEAELRVYQNLDNKLAQAALMWKMIYHVAHIFQERTPNWIFVRHEDLCGDPIEKFRTIFSNIGLDFTQQIEQEIMDYSSSSNPVQPANHWDIRRNSRSNINAWHNYFSRDQIGEIYALVEPISRHYYQDNEWPLA